MKTRKIELDVDFIGGQGSLTTEEEKALSNFFQQRRSTNKASIKSKRTGRPKTIA